MSAVGGMAGVQGVVSDGLASAGAGNKEALTKLVVALSNPVGGRGLALGYRLMLLLAAAVMVMLPVIYVGLIALVGYAIYWHAVNDIGIFAAIGNSGRGRGGLLALAIYLGPIFAGLVAMFFMVKPFFAPRQKEGSEIEISRKDEPVLFEVVERLCDALGAPRPTLIEVDTQVNASASFVTGWSLVSGKLRLTIGLPLVAGLTARQFLGVLAHEFGHFAQGSGMRVTYVVRTISAWFGRIVYERDAWDAWLETQAAQSEHGLVSLLIGLCRLAVWLSRRVLWCLMWVGVIVSSFLLRRMEYDADTFEVRVAGSEAFAQTVDRLAELGLAANTADEGLGKAWRDRQLPDDFVAMLGVCDKKMPAEVRAKVREMSLNYKAGIMATHPSSSDRVAAARKLDKPGIIEMEGPATQLFADFAERCKMATLLMYKRRLGDQLQAEHLVSAEAATTNQEVNEHQRRALRRYFQSTVIDPRQGLFPQSGWMDGRTADDVAAEVFELRGKTREAADVSRAEAKAFGKLLREESETSVVRGVALMAGKPTVVSKLGIKTAVPTDIAEVSRKKGQLQKQMDASISKLNEAASAGMKRMMLVLATGDREKVGPTLAALVALRAAWADIQVAFESSLEGRGCVACLQSDRVMDKEWETLQSVARRATSAVERARGVMRGVKYPVPGDTRTLSDILLPKVMPPEEDVIGQFRVADGLYHAADELYFEFMATLACEAERLEAEMGLEPLEEPAVDLVKDGAAEAGAGEAGSEAVAASGSGK